MSTEVRFAWAPVAERAAVREMSVGDVARLCGVTPRTVARWSQAGLVESQADLVAVRAFSLQPCEVWHSWGVAL